MPFENSGDAKKRERVSAAAVQALFVDLEKYDAEHGYGAWAGRNTAASLSSILEGDRKEKDTEEITGSELIQESVEKNAKLEELLAKHEATLDALGLSLDSPNKLGDYDGNETYAVGEMGIDIVDKEKFIGYLQSLQGNEEGDVKFAEVVLKKVLRRIGAEYSFESADDRLLEVLSGARGMAQEAKRLGLSNEAVELERCADYSKQRALPDYVFAREKGFLEPIGEGFSFSTYQQDANYESYIGYWKSGFEMLDRAKSHPKSAQLYQDIRAYLNECIAFAEKDPRLESPSLGPELKKAIAETKKKLETYS